MILLSRIIGGLRALFTRRRDETELDEELRAYVEAAAERRIAAGATPDQARRAARAEIGSLAAVKDYTRDAGWEHGLETLLQDARYALRSFRRAPGFTAAAVVTLALGVGGTTAIFSVVDGLFLRPPDGVSAASSLRRIFVERDAGPIQTPGGGPGSWVDYVIMREQVPAFAGVAAHMGAGVADLGRGPTAERVRSSVVSHEYFTVLGVRPALGRFFLPSEDGAQGAHPVAVISYGMWQRRFGGAADAIGQSIVLDGTPLQVVGVAARPFRGIGADDVDVWVPSSVSTSNFGGTDWRTSTGLAGVHYVARLADGATEAMAVNQASAALTRAATGEIDPTPRILTASIAVAAAPYSTRTGDLSLWLAVVAALVLVVACANVANLLLARGLVRRRELAVRVAVGAGRWRVIRQQLTESILLALLGGSAGVVLAYWAGGLMAQFPVPSSAGRIDERLLVFALTVSLATGILFGLLPALRTVQAHPVLDLKDSRSSPRATGQRTRRTLVALQVAVSLALLVGAALFVRSLRQVALVDGGADLDRVLVARVDVRRTGAIDADQFYAAAAARVAALPGVERSAVAHLEPYSGVSLGVGRWRIPGRLTQDNREIHGTMANAVGPGYFSTVGNRIVSGREFVAADDRGEDVAIVNEPLAREMADGGNIVGACVAIGAQVKGGGCTRIVGVSAAQRHRFLEEEVPAMLFLLASRAPAPPPWLSPVVLVRTVGDADAQVTAVRAAIQAMSGELPYVAVEPLAENVRDELLPFRLGATLFSLFGLLALSVAGVGLYGVLGYFVSERTPEIGIRRSLGAPSAAVLGMVVRQGLAPVAVGLVAGLGLAFAASRYLESLLFGVEAHDPLSFGAAIAFLAAVAIIGCVAPMRRAACVDPIAALRGE